MVSRAGCPSQPGLGNGLPWRTVAIGLGSRVSRHHERAHRAYFVPREPHGPHQEIEAEPRHSPAGGRAAADPSASPQWQAKRRRPARCRPFPGQAGRAPCRGNRGTGQRPHRSLGGGRRAAPVDGADRQRRQRGRRRVAGAVGGDQAGRRQPRASRARRPKPRAAAPRPWRSCSPRPRCRSAPRCAPSSATACARAPRCSSSASSSGARRTSARSPARSAAFPTRPTFWRSMPPSRRRGPAITAAASPSSPTRCARWPRPRRRARRTSRSSRPRSRPTCARSPPRCRRPPRRRSANRRPALPWWRRWMGCATTCRGSPRAARTR